MTESFYPLAVCGDIVCGVRMKDGKVLSNHMIENALLADAVRAKFDIFEKPNEPKQ